MIQITVDYDQLRGIIENAVRKVLEETKQQASTPTTQESEFLDIHGASELLGLTVPTIYSKVSRNELPVMKRDKRLYFSRVELLEYIKAGRKKTE